VEKKPKYSYWKERKKGAEKDKSAKKKDRDSGGRDKEKAEQRL